ncbi:hypothetical protein K2173_001307 [Erythroxylum novogranatense]|uniref:THH1/TOM1/TOM3 domain-containing protein n=1 Tax=Erythroxylum novogranatense TaxID=1862640 RepID=A0AAV8T4E7_9ROSI|nr:hypothetical protein K2173_001307 [Erythroxylum novogranatense]
MFFLGKGSCCFPSEVVGVNVGLAFLDGTVALFAFIQLIRINSRNAQLGWTRQKVLHLLIGCSNIGYFAYFVLTLAASCERWLCWSHSCGFILMAFPKILSFAAFLLILSFWIDLFHQDDDEDYEDEDFSFQETLLDRALNEPNSTHEDSHRICLPLRSIHVESRQKLVILVTLLMLVLMVAFSVLIWIAIGNNSVNSSLLATVYVDIFATAMLLLGLSLACYGLILWLKIRRVRSEITSSDMWKVAGLALVSVICFSSSAFVAYFTKIPVLYYCQQLDKTGLYTCFLLILYYFIGSSVPSAFVLWITRELPLPAVNEEIPQGWTSVSSTAISIYKLPYRMKHSGFSLHMLSTKKQFVPEDVD